MIRAYGVEVVLFPTCELLNSDHLSTHIVLSVFSIGNGFTCELVYSLAVLFNFANFSGW